MCFKKGSVVRYKKPFPDEVWLTLTLLENPEGGRVLAEANVDMVIKPTYILNIEDIEEAECES